MKQLTIEIDKNTWEVTINAEGYRGGECIKDIDKILEIIGGGRIINRTLKPEVLVSRGVTIGNSRDR